MRHPASDGVEDRREGLPLPMASRSLDGDVVFDFSGHDMPDIRGLTLLVTARMLAERQDRAVWVRALPHRSWELLETMGLAHLFRFFPQGGASDH